MDAYHENDPRLRGVKEKKLPSKYYDKELFRLQVELVKLQEWVQAKGLRVAIIFEGRDAAGKGGVIKRIVEYMNPGFAGLLRYLHQAIERRPSGTSNVISTICRQQVR